MLTTGWAERVWDGEKFSDCNDDSLLIAGLQFEDSTPGCIYREVASNHILKSNGQRTFGNYDTNCQGPPEPRTAVELLKQQEMPSQLNGFNLFFLPSNDEQMELLRQSPPTSYTASFQKFLSDRYPLPDFFWKRAAYEANGFHCSWNSAMPKDEADSSHWSMSRFLIKAYQPDQKHYQWHYISLCSLWFRKPSSSISTQVFFCFGMPQHMRVSITKHFQSAGADVLQGCPYAGYAGIMETIVEEYDEVLWRFRKPLRHFEKERSEDFGIIIRETATAAEMISTESDTEVYDPGRLVGRYGDMKDLGRHLIHACETLKVATQTLQGMIDDHEKMCPQCDGPSGMADVPRAFQHRLALRQTTSSLRFYASLLSNLYERAQAFDQRLRNEVQLAFNVAAADDHSTSKDLLKEMKSLIKGTESDGRELTTTVSLLTLIFLPGTFISGFFGMNFFDFSASNDGDPAQWVISSRIWIFFALTVPVTIVAVLLWLYWKRDSALKRKLDALKKKDGTVTSGLSSSEQEASDEEKGLASATSSGRLVSASVTRLPRG